MKRRSRFGEITGHVGAKYAVRYFGEYQEGFLIRIYPREPEFPPNRRGVSLAMTALSALQAIHAS